MSLHRQNNTHDKNNARLWILSVGVCLLLCVLLIGGISFARYVGDWNGRLDAEIAQWNIKVNGVSLADTAAASKIAVTMYTQNGDGHAPSEIIEPGQSGYFDIEINPCATEATETADATPATEVSFTYTVALNTDAMPTGMRITGYSLSDGSGNVLTSGTETTVSRTVELPKAGAFTKDDIHTVRFTWEWETGSDYDEDPDYYVYVIVSAEQYFGGQTA